jgi:RNase adaptor protein for sRNA GlmZ degradation
MTDRGMEDFVVITGFSGAGKSQAMATFEDAGYFCVDNLPPGMIRSLAELFGHEGSNVERAAVASDVRGGEYFDGLVRVLDDLDAAGLPYRVLYLEADDGVLINRFKDGSPRDADLTFDVRFLPNPHYEAELREQTGLDADVIRYVENSDGVGEFYARLTPLLDYLLPAYEEEGKSHLTVAIGCTGGRHRSVVIAEHLVREYQARGDFMVEVVHRDVDKPPHRP